jgi:hypothetical protein
MNEENKNNKVGPDNAVDSSRREAMLKMAAYTAPVLLMTLTSEKAMAVSGQWRGHKGDQNDQGQNNNSQ